VVSPLGGGVAVPHDLSPCSGRLELEEHLLAGDAVTLGRYLGGAVMTAISRQDALAPAAGAPVRREESR
jgi:hypothetical protein